METYAFTDKAVEGTPITVKDVELANHIMTKVTDHLQRYVYRNRSIPLEARATHILFDSFNGTTIVTAVFERETEGMIVSYRQTFSARDFQFLLEQME